MRPACAAALAFFRSAGKAEKFAPGATIFREHEKSRLRLLAARLN